MTNVSSIQITHTPRTVSALQQDSMPSRYSLWVQWLSMAAFTLAFVGWLNETWLFWFDNPIWLNRYTEYAIILGFGIWRISAERNSYTRKRLIVLVAVITGFWWLIPWVTPTYEPYVGYLWSQPVFPSLHVPGTITFFLVLGLVFLFGRRVICGWGCPCVGIRETVGFSFRDRTVRSKWAWRLRHSKWFFFIYYVGVMIVTQYPPNSWTVSFVGGFYLIVALTYFGTFFAAPLVGNRFYCRYLCPYGATFGLLNHAGYYGIDMEKEKCNDCRRCEQVCDMGIPVWEQGKQHGRITALEDCMGCGRCVVSCPTDALEFQDVRNLFRPNLKQNASHLLKKKKTDIAARIEPTRRLPNERQKDWQEIVIEPSMEEIQLQAARCIDCGIPGCSNACPLSNRIPEWLEAVANGQIEQAASISHTTSNMPEVCGRLCPQHRLCEGECTKEKEGKGAVTIGAIERYITDEAFRRGWQPDQPCVQPNGKKVAIVGAGPAGLACAEQLNRSGFKVTVIDREGVVGGLLATGVPNFKLDKTILQHRQQLLQQAGIEFKLNVDVDETELRGLLENNDALFLGMGAQTSRQMQLPGQQLEGVSDALDYLATVNKSTNDNMADKSVVVIGGGDSAMDCARSAIRQQARSVTVIYRGKESTMRASPKEQQYAREEGVEFIFDYIAEEIIGEAVVSGVNLRNSEGSTKTIDCDNIIFAIGQLADAPSWMKNLGVETKDGLIKINTQGRSTHPQVYAGGDNTHGPALAVDAIAAGRLAATSIANSFKPLQQVRDSLSNLRHKSDAVQPLRPVAAMVNQKECP
ncbi:MAG: FAD-dependent oxidoreductase [Gammaproteobacteria bacterium]|nr:FAD-dependent oxidoreductase [Gammaproteobacteria bacterium]